MICFVELRWPKLSYGILLMVYPPSHGLPTRDSEELATSKLLHDTFCHDHMAAECCHLFS